MACIGSAWDQTKSRDCVLLRVCPVVSVQYVTAGHQTTKHCTKTLRTKVSGKIPTEPTKRTNTVVIDYSVLSETPLSPEPRRVRTSSCTRHGPLLQRIWGLETDHTFIAWLR